MALTALDSVTVPVSFWDEAEVLEILARRDIGGLFRRLQSVTRATQSQLGFAAGLSQAQVSEIMSGSRKVTSVEVLARITAGFHVPVHAQLTLFLGERQPPDDARQLGPVSTVEDLIAERFSGMTAAYSSRSAFTSAMPVHSLFEHASLIRAAGLSLNLLCQQYSDTGLFNLVNAGCQMQALFLDPDGEAIHAHELQEGYPHRYLSSLNDLNLGALDRVRDRLPAQTRSNMQINIYDVTIRFNIILIDDRLCIVQPYLPGSRGVDSPTFVINNTADPGDLYTIFEQVFRSTWENSRAYERL